MWQKQWPSSLRGWDTQPCLKPCPITYSTRSTRLSRFFLHIFTLKNVRRPKVQDYYIAIRRTCIYTVHIEIRESGIVKACALLYTTKIAGNNSPASTIKLSLNALWKDQTTRLSWSLYSLYHYKSDHPSGYNTWKYYILYTHTSIRQSMYMCKYDTGLIRYTPAEEQIRQNSQDNDW